MTEKNEQLLSPQRVLVQNSPMMRFALDIFHHALECFCSDEARVKRLAVLHFAQSIEISIKSVLVENNISIYEKDNRTIGHHQSLKLVSELWQVQRLDFHSRIELLIDERNGMQHKYGAIDDLTLIYHLETSYNVLAELMEKEFSTNLSDWIKDNAGPSIWEKIKFVSPDRAYEPPSSAALPNRSALIDFIDGFSRYENKIREIIKNSIGFEFKGSTLDFAMRAIGETARNKELLKKLPEVYRIRNKSVHGEYIPSEEEANNSLKILDSVIEKIGTLEEKRLNEIILEMRSIMRHLSPLQALAETLSKSIG